MTNAWSNFWPLQPAPPMVALPLMFTEQEVREMRQGLPAAQLAQAQAAALRLSMSGNVDGLKKLAAAAGAAFADGDRWVSDPQAVADGIMSVQGLDTVWRREADRVSMRYFGARAGAENTQAFVEAIEYANERGGMVTFLVGDGRYDIYNGDALPAIRVPRVGWRGVGDTTNLNFYDGTVFDWLGRSDTDQVIGGGLADMQLSYLSPGSSAEAVIAYLRYTSNQRFSNLALEQVRGLIRAGEGYEGFLGPGGEQLYRNTGQAFNIRVAGVTGGKRNDGRPLFRLSAGFGFSLEGANLFVSGVDTPAKGAPISTVEGTDMIRMTEGRWDTLEVNGGLYERFDHGLHAYGRVHLPKMNLRLSGPSFDYNASQSILLDNEQGASIANVKLLDTTYVTSWRSSGIVLRGQGAIFNVAMVNPQPHLCAESGIAVSGKVRRMQIADPAIHATGMLTPSAPAVAIGSDVHYWSIEGGTINAPSADEGSPYQSTVGLAIGAGADHYSVNTQAFGPLPYYLEANPTASRSRSVRGNITATPPAFNIPAIPDASSADWTLTPGAAEYVNKSALKLAVSVFWASKVERNGKQVATGGEFTLMPGDRLKVYYGETKATLSSAITD